MPDSDPAETGGHADPTAASEAIPVGGAAASPHAPPVADLEPVVARWNPQGMALLRALRTPGGAATDAVALVAPDDAATTLLRTELARLTPRVALTDALPDLTAVETTFGATAAPPAATLVLLDAGSVLGADAVRLISGLRAAGTTVLLAMNNIHAHAGWREARARDLAVLAANGFGDLDILPVSARLAAAARSGDTALLDRSGLSALHAALIAATASGGAADERARASVLTRVLTDTHARVVEQMESLRTNADATRWRAERAALLAARDGGRAAAMSTLRGQLHLARVDLLTETGAQVRTLHAAARAEIDRMPRAELADYPLRLQQTVTDLTSVVDRAVDRRIGEIGRRLDAAVTTADAIVADAARSGGTTAPNSAAPRAAATGSVAPGAAATTAAVPGSPVPGSGATGRGGADAAGAVAGGTVPTGSAGGRPDAEPLRAHRTELLGPGTDVLDSRSHPSARRGADPGPRVGPDPEPRHAGVEDHLMVALGASAGAGLGRLLVSPLSSVPALEVASVPVTLALGGVVAWWVVRARRQVADRAHLRQWVAEALVTVKAQLEQRVATALVETETALTERVMRICAERVVDNDRRVSELEARIRRTAAERPGQLAACERDIAVLEQYLATTR
ncbi:hypothetical protein [Nocardia higoensis]|uniref:hypothetical protein n=1 Tax=Nocardia higoensis TaxID=228599 RepID=UPI002B4B7060|nr:hypothetical protein [Nocardia higoensis]